MHSRVWRAADSHPHFIGLDLGTSGLKGVAINEHGLVVARGQASYPTHRPEVGASEQTPADWMQAVREVVQQLDDQQPSDSWAGIGLSGMIPTLVCIDNFGEAVGRSITWEDSRAEEFGDRLRDSFGAKKLYDITGQWVDGRYLLPMWQRLCDIDLEVAASTTRIASAKDYVLEKLTGVFLTDPSTATGFGCFDLLNNSWSESVISAADVTVSLPEIAPSNACYPLTQAAAHVLGLPHGLPVFVGAADSVLGALGMGATHLGDIAYVAGTSTVIMGMSDSIPSDESHRFIVTPMAHGGLWGIEMDLLSTGGAISWMSELLNFETVSDAMQEASQIHATEAPTFLPYVSPGEQGALWDPSLTGAMVGMNVTHTRGHFMRALINGIVNESKRCVEVLKEFGCTTGTITVAGGSALSPWFRQELADATRCNVVAPIDGDSDYSAIGAALLVLEQRIESSEQTTEQYASGANTTTISPKSSTMWDELFARHEQVRLSLHGSE